MEILSRTVSSLALAACLLAGAGNAPAQVAREYDLKATFLFNFAQFVEWPPSTFASADEPFTIGVLGEDPFGAMLDDVVHNERVNGRPIVIRRYRSVGEIKGCQILFISKSEGAKAGQILPALKGRSILTVGETDEVASQGGVIRFFTDKNKLRLRINTEAAKQENLTISSKLLRLAEVAGKPPGRK